MVIGYHVLLFLPFTNFRSAVSCNESGVRHSAVHNTTDDGPNPLVQFATRTQMWIGTRDHSDELELELERFKYLKHPVPSERTRPYGE
ncbi:hypothetical protein RvY_06774 [Ramazzottius varieornatus]|uniref:Secreted protein n=1 Tax=Ramazzottius varieornatus TaxID=947166 RepID=A0A1D1V600_RAMVA|nr:hypothetical protein RvY_06774 [Ramazzottius varieornatus]